MQGAPAVSASSAEKRKARPRRAAVAAVGRGSPLLPGTPSAAWGPAAAAMWPAACARCLQSRGGRLLGRWPHDFVQAADRHPCNAAPGSIAPITQRMPRRLQEASLDHAARCPSIKRRGAGAWRCCPEERESDLGAPDERRQSADRGCFSAIRAVRYSRPHSVRGRALTFGGAVGGQQPGSPGHKICMCREQLCGLFQRALCAAV